jgi:hypothetical protein
MGPEFNMLEETSGPPFSRIDNGCLCNTSPLQTPCGQGALSECYLGDAQLYLDPAYNNKSCSTAEITHRSPFAKTYLSDSLDAADASYRYPTTDVHFVFGGLDSGSAVPEALLWEGLISPKTPPTISCVPDAPHEIADVLDGATLVANDIISSCH